MPRVSLERESPTSTPYLWLKLCDGGVLSITAQPERRKIADNSDCALLFIETACSMCWIYASHLFICSAAMHAIAPPSSVPHLPIYPRNKKNAQEKGNDFVTALCADQRVLCCVSRRAHISHAVQHHARHSGGVQEFSAVIQQLL